MNRLALTLLSIAALSLAGCNKQIIDLNYKYKKKFIILTLIAVMKLTVGEIMKMGTKYK